MYNNELAHHGTKGMKWGVRRYQNKDGSLTPAGRKRYGSLEDAVGAVKAYHIKAKRKKAAAKAREARAVKAKAAAEAKAKAEQRAKDVADGKITAKKMTTEELQSRIDRLNMEKRYKELTNETESVGKKFAKKMWDSAIVPAVTDAGKAVLKDVLIKEARKKTGLDIDDKALDALDKEWKKLDLKQKISNAKKQISDNDKYMRGEESEDEALAKEAARWKNKSEIAKGRKSVYENEKQLKNAYENDRKEAEAERKAQEESSKQSYEYSMKGKDIVDSVLRTDDATAKKRIKNNYLLSDSQLNNAQSTSLATTGERYVADAVFDKNGKLITKFKRRK